MSGITMIVDVPDVALENIFSFLSYDDIAKNRQVSIFQIYFSLQELKFQSLIQIM